MVSAVIQMFFAGFDTTSSILSVALCCLARNQESQEKLFQEIADNFENLQDIDTEEELDYAKIQVGKYRRSSTVAVKSGGDTRGGLKPFFTGNTLFRTMNQWVMKLILFYFRA